MLEIDAAGVGEALLFAAAGDAIGYGLGSVLGYDEQTSLMLVQGAGLTALALGIRLRFRLISQGFA